MSGPVLPALLKRFEWHDLPFVRPRDHPMFSVPLLLNPLQRWLRAHAG
jgi:hypothetical protein